MTRELELQDVLDYVLEDDDSPYGGVAFLGETVGDFIGDDSDITTIKELNEALVECGIKPITEVF